MRPSPFFLDPSLYPARLRELPPAHQPRAVWISSALAERPHVAIVGTREPDDDAAAFAHALGEAIAATGAVVLSGGAVGIDRHAHDGALAAGGLTCVVAGTGCDHVYPRAHAAFFDELVDAGSTMLWPFAPHVSPARHTFLQRNAVLAALADALVVVQAPIRSGALHAAGCAHRLGRRTYAAAAPPWRERFEGCNDLIARGRARLLPSIDALLDELGLGDTSAANARPLAAAGGSSSVASSLPAHARSKRPRLSTTEAALPLVFGHEPAARRPLSADEERVVAAVSREPMHTDELVAKTSLAPAVLATALLTLSLEHVLVEGPGGFFRRNSI